MVPTWQRLHSSAGAVAGPVVRRPWLQSVLLAALVVAVLSPALDAGFIWDDHHQIVDSPTIRSLRNIPELFRRNVIEGVGDSGVNAEGIDLYRPLFITALTLIYQINGADAFWYHLACLLVHTGVCLLAWALARQWLTSPGAAAVVVLLCAFHPVTAEAYLWPSAISETMSAAGLLAAVLLLELSRGRSGGKVWVLAVSAGVLMLAGLLSKEVVLAALPVLGLWLWLGRGVRLRLQLPVWAAGVVFLVMRIVALGGLRAAGTSGEQRLQAVKNLPVLLLDGLRAMLAMAPVGPRHLSYDYQDLGWGWSLMAGLLLALLLAAAIMAHRRLALMLVALAALAMLLAPVAMVTTVPGWGGFARYLYLPWLLLAMALCQAGVVLLGWLRERRPYLLPVGLLVLLCYLAAQQVGLRQALYAYSSQEALARTSMLISPHVPEGYEWLGNVYLQRGELVTALQLYRQAMERGPDRYRPRHNVAAGLLRLGEPGQALAQLQILEERHGVTRESCLLVVEAQLQLGRWQAAAERLLWMLDRLPEDTALLQLQLRLLRDHPEQQRYRTWLEQQLTRPEHHRAAEAIRPLLAETGAGAPPAPEGS